jgi:hypothetical protein
MTDMMRNDAVATLTNDSRSRAVYFPPEQWTHSLQLVMALVYLYVYIEDRKDE